MSFFVSLHNNYYQKQMIEGEYRCMYCKISKKQLGKPAFNLLRLVIPYGDCGPPEFLIFPFSNLLIFILFPTS